MTARQSSRPDQKALGKLRREITRLQDELASTRSILEAITSGQTDAVIGPQCPYLLRAKEAEDSIKKLLQEKDTLIKEIHHRVKNNLQIILSLIKLQMGNEISAETRERLLVLQNRIRTIALIHEVFYRSEYMSSLNLAEYLERIAIHLFTVYRVDEDRVKLVTELEPVQANVNIAIPVGLIVNELVTNSVKHAFTGILPGQISLKLRSIDRERCLLQVGDNGRGLPEGVSWEEPTTLGLEIVRLLADQIEARVVKAAGPGTLFELTFKKS